MFSVSGGVWIDIDVMVNSMMVWREDKHKGAWPNRILVSIFFLSAASLFSHHLHPLPRFPSCRPWAPVFIIIDLELNCCCCNSSDIITQAHLE
jgi:hypothetical protein